MNFRIQSTESFEHRSFLTDYHSQLGFALPDGRTSVERNAMILILASNGSGEKRPEGKRRAASPESMVDRGGRRRYHSVVS